MDRVNTVLLGRDRVPYRLILRDQDSNHTATGIYVITHDRDKRTIEVRSAESVQTKYAAVNGIQNDLDRAAVVMLDKVLATADLRRDAAPVEFTLYHVPNRGLAQDVALAGVEQNGLITDDAKGLSAVMEKAAAQGKEVVWSVHSRGATVFNRALEHCADKNVKLPSQTVAVYGGAAREFDMRGDLASTGVRLIGRGYYDHPLDFVPQGLGGHALNPLKVYGSLLAAPLLFTDDSPHTWHAGFTKADYNSVARDMWEQPGVDLRETQRSVLPEQVQGRDHSVSGREPADAPDHGASLAAEKQPRERREHALMTSFGSLREEWKQADAERKLGFLKQVDELSAQLGGSDLAKITLRIAARDFVAGADNQDLLERRIIDATRSADVAQSLALPDSPISGLFLER